VRGHDVELSHTAGLFYGVFKIMKQENRTKNYQTLASLSV